MAAGPWELQNVAFDIESVEVPLERIDFDIDTTEITDHELLDLSNVDLFQYAPLESIPLEVESVFVTLESDLQSIHNTDLWGSIKPNSSAISTNPRTYDAGHGDGYSGHTSLANSVTEASRNLNQKTASASSLPKQDIMIRCSIALGLGLKSALFTFDRTGRATVREDSIITAGLSRSLAAGIVQQIGGCGENLRVIETGLERLHGNVKNPPSLVAAASAIKRVIITIKQHILKHSEEVVTVPQIQILFQLPNMLLDELLNMVKAISTSTDEIEIINRIVAQVEKHENDEVWFRPLALQILVLAVKPLLEQISWYIGLLPTESFTRSNEPQHQASLDADRFLISTRADQFTLCDLLSEEQSQTVETIYRNLELLRRYQPMHDLLNPLRLNHGVRSGLELASSWSDVEKLNKNFADLTENTLRGSNGVVLTSTFRENQRRNTDSFELSPYGLDLDEIQSNMMLSLKKLGRASGFDSNDDSDDLIKTTYAALHAQDFTNEEAAVQPSLATLKIESFTPLLQAQYRAVNLACLKLVVQDHDLLHNLDVLHDFYLFGSGMFAVHLKDALFSWNLLSVDQSKTLTDRRKTRPPFDQKSTWSPASGELRPLLSEMLMECYQNSHSDSHVTSSKELPGGLALTTRNLSQSELEACEDPHSLAAFDFLHLQYQPSGALSTVITKSILAKYENAFRFLLRLSRVLYVVDRIWLAYRNPRHNSDRTMLRYTHSIRHFTSALATYIFTSVAMTWHSFRDIIHTFETQLQQPDFSATYDVFQLGILHELALDKILTCLFLDHRSQQAQQALEKTLASILQVASATNLEQAHDAFSVFELQSEVFLSTSQQIVEHQYQSQQETTLHAELKEAWNTEAASSVELQKSLLSLILLKTVPDGEDFSDFSDSMDTS